MVRGATMFREAQKMPSEDLKRFTGMDEKTFWTHVERMKSNGVQIEFKSDSNQIRIEFNSI